MQAGQVAEYSLCSLAGVRLSGKVQPVSLAAALAALR
jgi:hypothetical protein